MASSFGDYNYYGGRQNTYTATDEQRGNALQPPNGDYANWMWIPGMGWQYTGNEEDDTAGKSSYLDKQTGERVHYEPERTFDRDQQWWDEKRPLINGMDAWKSGGDVYGKTEGGLYSAENPYVYTEEMAARDAEISANSIGGAGVYDPITDTTFYGGMSYSGDQTQGKTQEDYSSQDWSYLTNDRYYEGHDQLTAAGEAARREAMGGQATINPFIDSFSHDVSPLLAAFNDKGYNPFYGATNQKMIDRSRELGHIGEGLTAYERRSDNNIMDYLYREFGGLDQVKNRSAVADAWNKHMESMNLSTKNFYNAHMNEATYKKLGLDKYKDFNADFHQAKGGFSGENPFGSSGGENRSFLDGYNENKPKDTPTFDTANRGLMSDDSGFFARQPKAGGFLDTYLKRKNESKPSVMSLMKEAEEYK